MRASVARIATTILVGMLVVACAPAPSPSSTPASSALLSAATLAPGTLSPTQVVPSISPVTPVGLTPGVIAAGSNHTCALTTGRGVECWGANDSGQLGDGTTIDRGTPVGVSGLASGVTAVVAGGSHTCALASGKVMCWGARLGIQGEVYDSTPVGVVGLPSGVSAITAGFDHVCALTNAGAVSCWGAAPGSGKPTYSTTPVGIPGLSSGVSAIAAGEIHTCALMSGGGVRCWGNGGYGQLGNRKNDDRTVPVNVSGLDRGVTAIAAGGLHTCALTNGGLVRCWGDGLNGQSGTSNASNVPVDVPGLTGPVAAIAAGAFHTCALPSGGGVTCWGANESGQLGDGTTRASIVPVAALGLSSGVTAIAAGTDHTCAVTSDARVTCWGSNGRGQLGSVQRCISNSVPVAVGTPSSEPTGVPNGQIAHPTGRTDVILRFDNGPDHSVSDLGGERFEPGPEFTLYGDGTAIFRNDLAHPPAAEGPIVRSRPFKIAHLTDAQVQDLLRFALGKGGLWSACERYETRGIVDFSGSLVFTVRAGGLDKVVTDAGADAPFAALSDRLRNLDRGGAISSKTWVAGRYWGVLLDATLFIKEGLLPAVSKMGAVRWPWPGIAPAAFVGSDGPSDGRRVMSKAEAAVVGLSRNGGVVQRIYVRGPNGKTIYSFSLWPILPDETP